MAVVLALGAALAYGSADFMGGLVSRRTAPLAVALGAQLSGLGVLVLALPLLGPSSMHPSDLAWGGLAGLFGGFGIVALYHVLARGPMSVVAPTTALSAAVVPILAGLVQGDRPGPLVALGMGVSFVAVLLITREGGKAGSGGPAGWPVLAGALASGAVFGLFFVSLDQAGDHAGLWPLLGARLVSVPALGLLVWHRRQPLRWSAPGVVRVVIFAGALDMGANIAYLVALRHGMLPVVAAVAGLYPASTVLLARTRLGERLRGIQVAGLVVAACAAVLIAS